MSSSSRSADVLVIGAGVIGLSTALELLRAGLHVTVLERGAVGPGGASWAGGGILAPLEPNVDPSLRPLLRDSLAGYAAWCDGLHEDSGIDPQYLVSGLRVMAPGDANAWRALAADCALELIEAPAPNLVSLPTIAQVRSPRLLRALAQAVRKCGGVIEEGASVQGLLGSARVEGVMTDRGSWSAQAVVLAAGAWSGLLAVQAHVRPVRGEMLLLEAAAASSRAARWKRSASSTRRARRGARRY
jgi:glycine oxidase